MTFIKIKILLSHRALFVAKAFFPKKIKVNLSQFPAQSRWWCRGKTFVKLLVAITMRSGWQIRICQTILCLTSIDIKRTLVVFSTAGVSFIKTSKIWVICCSVTITTPFGTLNEDKYSDFFNNLTFNISLSGTWNIFLICVNYIFLCKLYFYNYIKKNFFRYFV